MSEKDFLSDKTQVNKGFVVDKIYFKQLLRL